MWIFLLAGLAAAAQPGPEYSREEPKSGMVLAYREGRVLVGRGLDGPGLQAIRLVTEDREGQLLREVNLRVASGGAARFRVTAASLTADGEVVAGGTSIESPRRLENLLALGGSERLVGTGGFSCTAVAAANLDEAWCLGFYMDQVTETAGPRHLFYRVARDGKISSYYPLPAKADERTAEGLSRFPALGLPSLWANADRSVWAWLPGDRKLVRFDARAGKLAAWDVPVPKGGTAGVSLAVTSAGRALALLPVSLDGWRVAPGPSPVFALFELNLANGQWERNEQLPQFKRGARIIGADERALVVSNRETGRLEWYPLR
jgi:hypothetical protein